MSDGIKTMRVIQKYIRDDFGIDMKRIDPNKKYAEAFSLSKFAMRQLQRAVDIDEKMHWDELISACDRKMTFWGRQAKFDLQEMLRLAARMKV